MGSATHVGVGVHGPYLLAAIAGLPTFWFTQILTWTVLLHADMAILRGQRS
jgi:hypothetical protein